MKPTIYTMASALINGLTDEEYYALKAWTDEHTTCSDPLDYIVAALEPAFKIGR